MSTHGTRESLKALHERLTTRVESVQISGSEANWLAVDLCGRRMLLPLVQSGEIFSVSSIRRVPRTQPWFLGVAVLRGGLMGVVDLGVLLKLRAPFVGSGDTEAKLVALNPALGVNVALWVDRLLGLRGVASFNAVERPAPNGPPAMGQVLIDADGQRWQEISLQDMAEWPEFLSVAT